MSFKLRNTLLALSLLSVSALSLAQEHRGERREEIGRAGGHDGGRDWGRDGGRDRFRGQMVLDHRYHHDHYYPATGQVMLSLPLGAVSIGYRGLQFFYQGGIWLRPMGERFVVVAPPLGVIVPSLPPSYVTLMINGLPYFYANGAYYNQVPGQGFAVVPTPIGAEYAQPIANPPPMGAYPAGTPAPPMMPPPQGNYPAGPQAAYPSSPQGASDPIVYPRNGQSPARSAADQNECRHWAAGQPNGSVDGNVYQRGLEACLEGRGYTVR